LRVEQKFLRQNVQHNAVFRKRDAARGFDGVAHVIAIYIARAIADGDSTAAGDAVNVAAGDADYGALNRHASDALGNFKSVANRTGHGFKIHDQTLADALRFGSAHGKKAQAAELIPFGDERAGLCAANVERYQMSFFLAHSAAPKTFTA
jgi:hypothetical protein